MSDFPKYFRHTTPPQSDAMFVRFDNDTSDCVVITTSGNERPPSAPWPLSCCLLAEAMGMAEEIDQRTADELLQAVASA